MAESQTSPRQFPNEQNREFALRKPAFLGTEMHTRWGKMASLCSEPSFVMPGTKAGHPPLNANALKFVDGRGA
jgi:hypothetical protein